MAVKLTVVYTKPDDADEFDRHYREVHMPLVQRWPGLKRAEVARVTGGPAGMDSPYHLITELYFDDAAALDAALASDPGREAGKDFMAIAGKGSFMTVAEVQED